ncbi:PLP-dependent cysteine synthase family protein [Paenibacillus nicotianae]|uniref:PLP-dependent cysteine synthase family protein n=1 Tax=Paenibacillus nicotianae TaxID=1526551 RepID=A0ABW4UR71_9BACL
MRYETVVDSIGQTPTIRLRLGQQAGAKVYAKMEMQNLFGMKDRVAKRIIEEAKKNGFLKEGAPIIESSSGTMACGLALVGTYLGHEVHIVTDPRIDDITLAKLHTLGCHIHIVDKIGTNGWQSARLERLHELLYEMPEAFWPQQYDNPNNPNAYDLLAAEAIADLGHIDVLVGSIGSGGSLCGSAKALRTYNPAIKIVAVDCAGSVIFGQPDYPQRLQGGLGNSLIAGNVDYTLIDEVHWLNDEEAFAATHQLAKTEKIFAGNSSGSVYAVAKWISSQLTEHKNILAIFPDRGDRYVDTIYNPKYLLNKGLKKLTLSSEPQYVSYDTVVHSWSYANMVGVGKYV